jgi:hypothetical protein
VVTFEIPITRGTTMETKSTKTTGPKDLKKKRDPPQGDPYEKYFSRGLEAPVHR